MAARFKSKVYRQRDCKHKQRIRDIDSISQPLNASCSLFPSGWESEIGEWQKEFDGVISQLGKNIDFTATADESLLWLQYMMVRATKPNTVLETGVWIGGSSFTILTALRANGSGVLYSIDFPPFRRKNRVEVGHLVPPELYDQWKLHLGPSKSILKNLAKQLEVDLFIHDSDHTYMNMMNEFNMAWRMVKSGGYIISDDSSMNDSVIEFSESKACDCLFLKRKKGGTIAIMSR